MLNLIANVLQSPLLSRVMMPLLLLSSPMGIVPEADVQQAVTSTFERVSTKVPGFMWSAPPAESEASEVGEAFARTAIDTEHASADSDGDGLADDIDADDDNDGHLDAEDFFPLNPVEWSDTDGDGIGNNGDSDDDGDGIFDTDDKCPLTPQDSEQQAMLADGDEDDFCYQVIGSQEEWDAIGGGISCQLGPPGDNPVTHQGSHLSVLLVCVSGILGVARQFRKRHGSARL